ncbi:selenium cofactor biosynthesis protein YqeC [Desulfococcaceae bacterium HSG9]|nr:selenium cofactor biosynthesis protein YqeC [Desulfococcaceae bacterium HSG9]
MSDVAPGVVAIAGAGGKTTLMFHLAHELASGGETVLTTTTTKIFYPLPRQSRHVIISENMTAIIKQAKALLHRSHHITAAARYLTDSQKLVGFQPAMIQRLWETGLFRHILVEADGAARRPLKAHASHEPVIPPHTKELIVVVGLSAVGKSLSEDWVFRSEIYSKLSGLPASSDCPGALVTSQSVVTVLLHPEGILQGCPANIPCHLFLNQADDQRAYNAGRKIVALLSKHNSNRFDQVWIGSLKSPLPLT